MIDTILTYAIVAVAAVFVVWKIILPVRARTKLRYALAGRDAPCAPDAAESGCAGGCPGCGLAKGAEKRR